LAIVQDGDRIHVDIPNRTLTLEVEEGEITRRLAELAPWEPSVKMGYLRRYAQAVTSACTGAVFRE
jgi:dihydroxy-acid dehydratase